MTTEIENNGEQVFLQERLTLEMASAILLTQVDQIKKQTQHQITEGRKFATGLVGGGVQCIQETAQSLVVASDYYDQSLKGSVNLASDIKEFGSAIAQPLCVAGDYYFQKLPKGQSNFGQDVGQAAKAAGNHWNSLDSEQKGNFIGYQALPFAVTGAIGFVAKEAQSVNLLGKVGELSSAITNSGTINQIRAGVQRTAARLQPRQLAFETVGVSNLPSGYHDLSITLPKSPGAKIAGSAPVIVSAMNEPGKKQHVLMMSQSENESWRIENPPQESITNRQNDKHLMESQRANKGFKPIEEAEEQARKDIEVDKERVRQGQGNLMGQWYFRVSDRVNKYLNFREIGHNGPERTTYWKQYRDTYAKLREEDSVLREFM